MLDGKMEVFVRDGMLIEVPSWGNEEVAIVWLNNDSRMNALSTELLQHLVDGLEFLQREWVARRGLKVVLLLGKGRCLSAGMDLKEEMRGLIGRAASATEKSLFFRRWRYDNQLGRRAMQAIEDLEAMTICGVHKYALGGGWCLALACDFKVATEDTIFQMPEINIALPLTWGCTPRLVREVGFAKAKELISFGERVSAPDLLAMGGLNKVVKDVSALHEEVFEMAKKLSAKDPFAMHIVKTQFRGLAKTSSMGDMTEADGDYLLGPLMLKKIIRNKL